MASGVFPESGISQKLLQFVTLLTNNTKTDLFGIRNKRIFSAFHFSVRMDIMGIEKTHDGNVMGF
jgi:hypothetical protein